MNEYSRNLGDLLPFNLGGYEVLIHENFDQDLINKIYATFLSHL